MDQQKRFFAPSQNDRDELIQAASHLDYATIDTITDRLVQQGMCRPRADDSRAVEWAAMRRKPAETEVPAEVAGTDIGSQIAAHFRGVFAGGR